MTYLLRSFVGSALIAVCTQPSAQDLVLRQGLFLRLVCKYLYTVDEKGKTSGRSGEDLLTIRYTEDGHATIKKQDLGAEFSGTITTEEIYGKVTYVVGERQVQQVLNVNRYTGIFSLTFEKNSSSIVHWGKCEPADKPLL